MFEPVFPAEEASLQASRVGSMVRVRLEAEGMGTLSCITQECTAAGLNGNEVAMEETLFVLVRPLYPKTVFAANSGVTGDVKVQGRVFGNLNYTDPQTPLETTFFAGPVSGDGKCSSGACEALLSFNGCLRGADATQSEGLVCKERIEGTILFKFNFRLTIDGLDVGIISLDAALPMFLDVYAGNSGSG